MIAAAAPWASRAAMRSPVPGARAHSAEVTAKAAIPSVNALPPVVVTEPASGHQEGRAGQGVPGDHPLDGGGAGVQPVLDVRQREVDDEEVEDVDEGAAQRDGERCPPGGGAARRRVAEGDFVLARCGHEPDRSASPYRRVKRQLLTD
jgi:hypothetical protein